nr:immunoglobulin heavy chain junction region [Mus musculus]
CARRAAQARYAMDYW